MLLYEPPELIYYFFFQETATGTKLWTWSVTTTSRQNWKQQCERKAMGFKGRCHYLFAFLTLQTRPMDKFVLHWVLLLQVEWAPVKVGSVPLLKRLEEEEDEQSNLEGDHAPVCLSQVTTWCTKIRIAPIGAWKYNFPPFWGIMTDGPTDGQEGS